MYLVREAIEREIKRRERHQRGIYFRIWINATAACTQATSGHDQPVRCLATIVIAITTCSQYEPVETRSRAALAPPIPVDGELQSDYTDSAATNSQIQAGLTRQQSRTVQTSRSPLRMACLVRFKLLNHYIQRHIH
jgi:hypothetical protein